MKSFFKIILAGCKANQQRIDYTSFPITKKRSRIEQENVCSAPKIKSRAVRNLQEKVNEENIRSKKFEEKLFDVLNN